MLTEDERVCKGTGVLWYQNGAIVTLSYSKITCDGGLQTTEV